MQMARDKSAISVRAYRLLDPVLKTVDCQAPENFRDTFPLTSFDTLVQGHKVHPSLHGGPAKRAAHLVKISQDETGTIALFSVRNALLLLSKTRTQHVSAHTINCVAFYSMFELKAYFVQPKPLLQPEVGNISP
jgi:hypothetical protein